LVYDPLAKSHSAFDSAVRNAGGSTRQGGDYKLLKDAIKKRPKIQAKKKKTTNSVNA